MSGLYIHIPFCRKACHYCNFHFSTSLKQKEEMLSAILKEIVLRKDFLQDKNLQSIYFGGGTPSVFSPLELASIIDQIDHYFYISPNAEITIEANPDDLKEPYLQILGQTQVNRLSIGIQSFFEKDLLYMNRSHNSEQAKACIELSQKYGFHNLSVDLIYGTPGMDNTAWEKNLSIVQSYDIPHLSCYNLTVEDQTALAYMVKKGTSPAPDDQVSAEQLSILIEFAKDQNYSHYEISNFAKKDMEAVHNSNYWKGIPYLGIGPAAHSFNGTERQWNIANNSTYLKSIKKGDLNFEREILSTNDQYNEYILTGLRTKWGCSLGRIMDFGQPYASHFLKEVKSKMNLDQIIESDGTFVLSEKGKFFADQISADLFFEEINIIE